MKMLKKVRQANDLMNSGQLDEAEELLKHVLKGNPKELFSLFLLGTIAMKRDDPHKALAFFDRALKVNPNFDKLWYNRGVTLVALKQHSEAIESYEHALRVNPNYPDALNNLGVVQHDATLYKDAVITYDRLLALNPVHKKALVNKGFILMLLGQYYEAIECIGKLLAIDVDFDLALGLMSSPMQYGCIWDDYERIAELTREGVRAGKRVCKSLPLMSISDSPAEHFKCAQVFANVTYPPSPLKLWQGEIYQHQKIRIAYVSPDLREHPVAHLLAGILEHHDKSHFETYGFSLVTMERNSMQERLATTFDRFIDVQNKGSKEIAGMIRAMEIDIVVDLAGYTQDSRTDILAYRPAPVHVNYLGYPGTLGVEYMDYILADSVVIPGSDQEYYSEKVVHLPGAYLPADATLKVADEAPPRAAYGLPSTGFVFCSFNHAYKINPTIFDVWMRILKRCPDSVLWLMKLNMTAEPNLRKEAEARGVDPSRLIFATRVPRVEDHLARYRLADLFLDTTPYNAHTTACDALFVGLPVLTFLGKSFPARVAASLLRAIGLTDLITYSLDDYENLAVTLAHDAPLLTQLREKLKANRATYPLFKTEEFCRNLEYAYTAMWQRTQRGEEPMSFQVIRN